MVHDAIRCGQHNVAKLTRWQNVTGNLFNATDDNIEAWGDDTTLVDAANQFNHHLACTVIINDFKITNVAVLLHHMQKFDDHFGIWSDHHLALSTLLSIADGIQAITQHTDPHHGLEIGGTT